MFPRSLRAATVLFLGCAVILADPFDAAAPQSHSKRHGRSRTSADLSAGRKRRAEMQNRLQGLHGRMHRVRSSIHEKKVQEIHITESIGVVEGRIKKTRSDLDQVNAQLETLDAQHEKVTERLEQTNERLAQEKQVLSQRLRDNYQRRQATYIQTLLQSASIHEMLSHAYLVRLIVQSDAELIASIQKDVRQIEADKRVIEKQERQQADLAARLEIHKKQLGEDVKKRRIILIGVRAARVEAEQELDDLESEANAMTDRIRALSEMLRRQQEAARRAEEAARRAEREAARRAHRPPPRRPAIHAPMVWHGRFSRPCGGPLTSGFGMRFHPILHRYRMHTGVDFGAGFGAPIRAAGGGIVLFSAYNRGYGNCVIIDHGSGVTTLYGHCSARFVREGQNVKQGQQIASVGATGLATGPHLHFEVRHNGVPVPPY